MTDRPLHGRMAWVTGAASGMGRGIALALARAGADIAVGTLLEEDRPTLAPGQTADLLSLEEMAQLQQAILDQGVQGAVDRLDIRSEKSVARFFAATVERFGRVDILVNVAYSGAKHPVSGHPQLLWDALVDTNLNGAFRTIRLCLPDMMTRRWGRIINIASTAASVGFPGSAAYCASKAALLGLTRCVALEGAAHGVSCNAISPGWVNSRQSREVYQKQVELDGLGQDHERLPDGSCGGDSSEAPARSRRDRRLWRLSLSGGGLRHHRRGPPHLRRFTVVARGELIQESRSARPETPPQF